MKNEKTGAPTLYGEPMEARIVVRVTEAQKKKIMASLGTANIRDLLLDYVENYNKNQLPLTITSTSGAAELWRSNEGA